MEQLIEDVTRGNVTEVKVMLASVVLALAVYQVLLAAVTYGRLRERQELEEERRERDR